MTLLEEVNPSDIIKLHLFFSQHLCCNALCNLSKLSYKLTNMLNMWKCESANVSCGKVLAVGHSVGNSRL